VWSNGLVKGEGGLITVTALPEQGGTISGGGFIGGGAECALSATPNVGYDFAGWMLNGVQVSTETSYTFTPSESGDYVALFALETYEVTSSADPEEGGEVTQGGTYTYGSQCTLMAVAKQDYTFLNWTKDGEVVSDNTVLNFEVTEDAHYVAHFYRSCTVTVSANPADGGVVGGGGVYEYGTTATVTVRTNPDYTFVAWTLNGVIVSREVSYSFEVTEDCHLVANLAPYDAVDESLTDPFVTYPNPAFAGEELNVAWPDELGKLHVEVYTAHGVLVTSKELGGDRTSLGNDLKAGVYLMKAVAPSGKTYYSKLVIEAR